MSEIELVKVSKTFGDNLIVDDVDLKIEDGCFTVLLGPSGCGKSTTLNMIAGLEDVTQGKILFDGKEVQDLSPDKRDVAMVFQSYALYPNRTVEENISFALKLRKLPPAEIRERVDQAAEMLDITPLLRRKPRQLSGGQQQRVALARSIVRRPNVFLLDEPLSNLDAKLRAVMRISLRELQRELKGTFVYVTHDQGEAMSMADHVVVMNDGVIQQRAAPLDLYRRPTNRFVAGFVGTPAMNFIDGTAAAQHLGSGASTALLEHDRPSGAGVTVGVRPEDVSLTEAQGGSGRVRFVERLGVEAFVVVELGSRDIIARADADVALNPGDLVAVDIKASNAHVFDTESGSLVDSPIEQESAHA